MKITDWPHGALGDVRIIKKKCAVCGLGVNVGTGLFWFSRETASFYHKKCAAELVSGLGRDIENANS